MFRRVCEAVATVSLVMSVRLVTSGEIFVNLNIGDFFFFLLQSFGSFKSWSVSVRETAAAQWLRCCATNRNIAGSIPDGIIGIFH